MNKFLCVILLSFFQVAAHGYDRSEFTNLVQDRLNHSALKVCHLNATYFNSPVGDSITSSLQTSEEPNVTSYTISGQEQEWTLGLDGKMLNLSKTVDATGEIRIEHSDSSTPRYLTNEVQVLFSLGDIQGKLLTLTNNGLLFSAGNALFELVKDDQKCSVNNGFNYR